MLLIVVDMLGTSMVLMVTTMDAEIISVLLTENTSVCMIVGIVETSATRVIAQLA
jgi:hypothetical protein